MIKCNVDGNVEKVCRRVSSMSSIYVIELEEQVLPVYYAIASLHVSEVDVQMWRVLSDFLFSMPMAGNCCVQMLC